MAWKLVEADSLTLNPISMRESGNKGKPMGAAPIDTEMESCAKENGFKTSSQDLASKCGPMVQNTKALSLMA